MLRLNMEVFYPYPPQQVWQVLTNRQALAAWLMENDFEPRLGHKFQFQHSTLPGLEGNIDCEVIELEEPKRLAFTWCDRMMCEFSIVTWILKPVDGGTKLHLEHKGLSQKAIKLNEPMHLSQTWHGQFMHESKAAMQTLVPNNRGSAFSSTPIGRYETLDSVIFSSFLNGGWNHRLNEKLPQILVSINSIANERF
ncbi:SRPBCC domain-containing protein [Komarekiella sp. 'clone 1']|uniref:SRPBCC domain-containing protein n=1 Tax=Komarekiella delphini-convector SJRDD-AB1 TaxID=2593771 RepID=A0AA40SXM3_9NOST|nr:SRPBCC domain-containing protein [Komarekiella delphini-convector]MBD6617183.1 SRPBCC domain-containing protein [Komarekiella delphini-convector SJRDD-AB1]